MRRTVQCVARTEVFGAGHALDRVHTISFVSHGGQARDIAPLRAWNGRIDVHLSIRERYHVVQVVPNLRQRRYHVLLMYYAYTVLDRDERELLAHHWHPEGVSDVTSPHLHIPRVAPIPLPRTDPTRAVVLGEMHLPTNHVLLEDVVELLIREFAIAPLRPDWQTALAESRSELDRDR
jgi:hypothetical protein